MIWQVCTLNPKYAKDWKKGKPVPLSEWQEKETIVARGYVKADEKAKRNHPNRIVHTYIKP